MEFCQHHACMSRVKISINSNTYFSTSKYCHNYKKSKHILSGPNVDTLGFVKSAHKTLGHKTNTMLLRNEHVTLWIILDKRKCLQKRLKTHYNLG